MTADGVTMAALSTDMRTLPLADGASASWTDTTAPGHALEGSTAHQRLQASGQMHVYNYVLLCVRNVQRSLQLWRRMAPRTGIADLAVSTLATNL
jgi:hypothetical protein